MKARHPGHGTVVAYLALFVALGGTSVAAVTLTKNSVKSKHIANGQVKRADIRDNAVNSKKVADGSLVGADFAPGQLPAGPPGPATGPAGGDLTGNYPNPQLATLPGARVRKSADQSAPGSGAETFLTWDTEVFDNGDVHSTASNSDRMTAPVAGTYLATVSVRWSSGGTGARYLGIYDSANMRLASVSDMHSHAGAFDQSVTTVVRLAAGDYVRAGVFNYDSVARSITSLEQLSSFSMELMSR